MERDPEPHEHLPHGFYGQLNYDVTSDHRIRFLHPRRRMNRLMTFGLGFSGGLILDGTFLNKIPGTAEELAVGILVSVGLGIAGIVIRNKRYARR